MQLMATNGETETLTPSAVQWLTSLAMEAQKDLGELPESAQPFWFRHNTESFTSSGHRRSD